MKLPESKVRVSTVALGVAFDLLVALYFLVRPDPGTVVVPISRQQRTTVPAPSPTPSHTPATSSPVKSPTPPAGTGSASATTPPVATPSPASSPSASRSGTVPTAVPTGSPSPSGGGGLLDLGSPSAAPSS